MKKCQLSREQWISRSIEDVFAFFANAKNLEAITPTWLGFQILSADPITLRAGAQVVYRLYWHRFPLRWVTEIRSWNPPTSFVDVQLRGPYSHWHHTHTFLVQSRADFDSVKTRFRGGESNSGGSLRG